LLRYEGHEDPVVALALSRDGALAASATSQGAIDLWEIAGATLRRSLYAARGPVWALALAPDGKTLLSSGNDGVVRLWDAEDGHELSGAVPPVSPPAEAETRGDKLFRKCRACHTLTPGDQGKAGPSLFGLFGRRAGSAPGYPYSAALRDSGLVWTPETVDRLFAQGPEVVAPGSKMPLQKMPDVRDRADLIEFLKHATVP
jgi:cytochrome c